MTGSFSAHHTFCLVEIGMCKHFICVIFSKCVSDHYRLKQVPVSGYKLLFSVLQLLILSIKSVYQNECVGLYY